MKRLILYVLLALLAVAALVWAVAQDAGYVLITYQRFRFESTFWVFLALGFGLWLLAFVLNRVLRLLVVSGALVNPWSTRHRKRRVGKAAMLGQRELAEGRWTQALEHLRVAAERDKQPLMHYLGAARAANEAGLYAESDALLDKALAREPDAALAVGLARSRLLIERGEPAQARDVLKTLHAEHPRNVQVLQLLQQIHVHLEEWMALCTLLPELRKLKVLPVPRLDELERLAWTAALEQSAAGVGEAGEGLERLERRWQDVPSGLRAEPSLVHAYAAGLARLGAPVRAEEVLCAALKRRFDDPLVDLYGRIEGRDAARQLAAAEGWLKHYPEDAVLLLALGRLSLRNQLWGKARDYFEASLRFAHRPETCVELARLLAHMGDTGRSNQLFQEGLGLYERSLPTLR